MPRKNKIVKIAEECLTNHKASEIVTIDVREKNPFADYYVLATASNIRQLGALRDLVIEELEKIKSKSNTLKVKFNLAGSCLTPMKS